MSSGAAKDLFIHPVDHYVSYHKRGTEVTTGLFQCIRAVAGKSYACFVSADSTYIIVQYIYYIRKRCYGINADNLARPSR